MRRHELDPLSLVFGLMLTAAGALLLSANVEFTDLHGEWLWPVPLVIVGVVMLVSALTRRDDQPGYSEPEPEPQPETSETERDETF